MGAWRMLDRCAFEQVNSDAHWMKVETIRMDAWRVMDRCALDQVNSDPHGRKVVRIKDGCVEGVG